MRCAEGTLYRFGFNNQGAGVIAARLAARRRGQVPVGLNLGANKDSEDRAGDFARVLTLCGPHADFVTVNVFSPNTERLRDLQGPAALAALLARVIEARADLHRTLPVFLKIAPDLNPDEIAAIAETAMTAGIDAIIATNTTLAREGLKSTDREQVGGLSGAPIIRKIHPRPGATVARDRWQAAVDRRRRHRIARAGH